MSQPTQHDADLLLRLAQLHAQLGLNDAMNWLWSDEFILEYENFVQKYPRGSAEYGRAGKIGGYFETVGSLWKHGLVNEDLLFDWLLVHPIWDRVRDHVLHLREAAKESALYENFEALALANIAWMRSRHSSDVMTNKALVRRFYEELNRQNLDTLDQFIAPSFTDRTPSPDSPTQTPGIEGVRTILRMRQIAFPDCHYSIDDIVGEGDEVTLRETLRGTHTGKYFDIEPTGKPIQVTNVHILRFVDGKVVENWDYGESLREQLGAARMPASAKGSGSINP